MLTTPLVIFLVLVAIGVIVGLLFNRMGRSWLGRQVTDATGIGDITYSLVGIAGSFMGYHIGGIIGGFTTEMLYLIALLAAVLTVWLWRGR